MQISFFKKNHIFFGFIFLFLVFICILIFGIFFWKDDSVIAKNVTDKSFPIIPVFDTKAYDEKMLLLSGINSSSTLASTSSSTITLWPPKTPYPLVGAILPFKRVVAYYGNLYSTKMGALGQYPEDEMLQRLKAEVKNWEMADPTTPVQPALHYIAITAQKSPGKDGKYRFRMPDSEIEKVLKLAEKADAIVFLDLQVALSDVQTEIPLLYKYLSLPQVHLGLDPEFSMKGGNKPGSVIGTMDETDINFAINYLAKVVRENNLPPKILVIHRFTEDMVTGYKKITPLPEVQIVMDMDGWGFKAKKINTYKQVIYYEPVQFTGFKLFYKNDVAGSSSILMTPSEVLKLKPQPIYIQYQ